MAFSGQRIGTFSVLIGSLLYTLFCDVFAPRTVLFHLFGIISILTLVNYFYDMKKCSDGFLKALGVSLYLIGAGFKFRSYYIYEMEVINFLTGGILVIMGIGKMYFKKGKPTDFFRTIHLNLGRCICAVGFSIIILDLVLYYTVTLRLPLRLLQNISSSNYLGVSLMMIGKFVETLIELKLKREPVEPDIEFFGRKGILYHIMM